MFWCSRVPTKYMQTHIVETWSRWCQTWRRSGYKDGSKPRSCPNHEWKSCVRFLKSTKGMEVSARMSYVQSCVQFVSTSGTMPNMSCMHELVIFWVHFFESPMHSKEWLAKNYRYWCDGRVWRLMHGEDIQKTKKKRIMATRSHSKMLSLIQNFLTSTQRLANLGIIDGRSMLWVSPLNVVCVLHSWIRMYVIWSISHHKFGCRSRWYVTYHVWIALHKGCSPFGD